MTITRRHVREIVTHLLHEAPVFTQKINNGVTNKVYKAVLKSGSYLIVRISPWPSKINHYLKEQWCCSEARKLGIPVPEILEVGNSVVPFPYMVATEIYGIPGNMYEGSCDEMFFQMGENAAKIHTIGTHGYGDIFDWSSNILSKNDSWHAFLEKELNIDRIMDFYEDSKIISNGNLKKMRQIARTIKKWKFEPRLCHSDLLPKNVIVSKEGDMKSIIDWEGARSSNAKIWDLAVTVNNVNEQQRDVFLSGYGISPSEYKHIEPEVVGFYILRKHDVMEAHVAKKEEQPFLKLQNKFNNLLDTLGI
jgi:Ser/Thr protein kinase RdoA (MazF antagonist)